MEGLYEGKTQAGLVAVGMITPGKKYDDDKDAFVFKIEIPKMLSLLGYRNADAFVPGVKDLAEGNAQYGIISATEKIERGKIAINTLREYKEAKKANDSLKVKVLAAKFDEKTIEGKAFLNDYFKYFGYGYLNNPNDIIPNVPITFYSFHIMVALGFIFILFFVLIIYSVFKPDFENKKWLLYIAIVMIPLAYIASQAGWIVAEMGRQPWVIQDLMPTVAAASQIDSNSVITTFFLFALIFTALLIAEIKILTRQIKIGPNDGGHK
jgi:cytochrome d ubiquinol oxidase subunit I